MAAARAEGPARVLVVDDQEEMRAALRATVAQSGFGVVAAATGQEALDLLVREPFDVVITDIRMPSLSGIDLLTEVKRMSPTTPVILITAYGTIDSAVEAMKKGAFDYLLKPFSAETLEVTVQAALDECGHARGKRATQADWENDGWCPPIITQDPQMLKVLRLARSVANSSATVLVQGESGTGKEMVARLIHAHSARKDRPFVAINCAALPEGLLESELFGHEKGAFTGALKRKQGKFEMANTGTMLLDEIGEMALPLQAKLLRALEGMEIDPVGGDRTVQVDVRVVATTNCNLRESISKGKFREDLFYRLNVIPLHLPPLRERQGDIALLAEYFLQRYSVRSGRGVSALDPDAASALLCRKWHGNVRELENTMERAVLLAKGDVLTAEDVCWDGEGEGSQQFPMEEQHSVRAMERNLILKTLRDTRGNRTKAAEVLGISVRTLRNKLKEYREAGMVVDAPQLGATRLADTPH